MTSNSKYNENSPTNLSTSTEICYCVCRSSHIDTFMICCDFCEEWFHGECIGVSADEAEAIEKYFCEGCRTSNSNLHITLKRKIATKRKKVPKLSGKTRIKHTPKKKSKYEKGKIETVSRVSENLDSATLETTQPPVSDIRTAIDEDLAIIFGRDTTRRKAKTIANKNIMEHAEMSTRIKKHNDPHPVLKQCHGPGCTKVARIRSKYCSDACGIRLGRNRILEILPQRLEQRKAVPCAADELSKRKLAAIRRRQGQLRSSIEQMDVKIVQLLQLVQKAKNPDDQDVVIEDESLEDENATSSSHCKVCGAEVQTRLLVRHMEHCYKKQEKRLMLTGTHKADDLEWNIFCNHKMGKQGYCKQLKATCPFHHRDRPNTDAELCGYPVAMNLTECSGKFCGTMKKNCPKHPKNWEDIFRADMDMQKWKFLWSLNLLEKEEGAVRREMAKRGNLMALLLHQTIVH